VTGLPAGTVGVAVLDGYAYTGHLTEVLKTDIRTGDTVRLAGGGPAGSCVDTTTGPAATFGQAQVIGTDQHLIYVSTSCGIRAVNPITGATHHTGAVGLPYGGEASIGGHTLYYIDYTTKLLTYDLQTATTNNYGPVCDMCSVTADDTAAWIINLYQHSLTKLTPTPVTGIPDATSGTF